MAEDEMLMMLRDLLTSEECAEELGHEVPDSVEDFRHCGLMTSEAGLVVRFFGGVEFQLTLVRSK